MFRAALDGTERMATSLTISRSYGKNGVAIFLPEELEPATIVKAYVVARVAVHDKGHVLEVAV